MDLSSDVLSVVALDQHAHNVRKAASQLPLEAAFTEATDPRVWEHDAPHTLFLRRSVNQLAALYDCEPELASLKSVIEQRSLMERTSLCLQRSNLKALLLDDGLTPDHIEPWTWHEQFVPTKRLLRIEFLAESLLKEHSDFEDFDQAYRHQLSQPAAGVVGLKTIVAYRGGLTVASSNRLAARAEFQAGAQRLTRSPFYSYILHTALEIASELQLPVQFHTGFGDPDLSLEKANPLLLRPLIEEYSCPFVLLHAGYPYCRETGFLSSVYHHVWADFGLALPFLSSRGMQDCLHALLELAPLNKVMYSSDASLIPELYYLGAINSRRVLSQVLTELCAHGDLSNKQALEAAHWLLRENAERLYHL